VQLAELTDGETLQGLDGLAVVLSVSLSRVSQPVYNIEVHGEHVHQVGELGVVVHNVSRSGWGAFGWGKKLIAPKGAVGDAAASARNFLGGGYKAITNKAGDTVLMSKDGLRKMRFDFNNTSGDLPHVHIEQFINGRWRDAIPGAHRIYPLP
jgi:hypothetical protein